MMFYIYWFLCFIVLSAFVCGFLYLAMEHEQWPLSSYWRWRLKRLGGWVQKGKTYHDVYGDKITIEENFFLARYYFPYLYCDKRHRAFRYNHMGEFQGEKRNYDLLRTKKCFDL